MTAKELHDHVIQWPEGARPKGLRLHTAGWFVEDRETGRRAEGETLRVDFQFCNPTTSIALHVASGLAWLADKLNGIRVFPQNDAGPGWYIDDNIMPPFLVARGTSLFHAIHKAILATKEIA